MSKEEVRKIFKDIASVSIFRFGSVLFNSVTNIVTSAVVGTIVVGYYSNYTMIVNQIEILFMLAIGAVGASIGNVVATETREKQYIIYKRLDKVSAFVLITCSVCLIQLLNSFVGIWLGNVGEEYVLNQFVVILIVANMYTNCSCQVLERFRTARGFFSIGRDLRLIGGVINIVWSVILAKTWGFEGVLISPFLCKMFITVTPFMVRVGKRAFDKNCWPMLWEYFSKMLVTAVICLCVWFICKPLHTGSAISFVIESILTLVLTVILLSLFLYKTLSVKKIIQSIRYEFTVN